MEESRVLFLSDASAETISTARSSPTATTRRLRSTRAATGRSVSIAGQLESALADARWLRRRRNRLPVIALVDTPDVARAAGAVRDAECRRSWCATRRAPRACARGRRSSLVAARAARRRIAASSDRRAQPGHARLPGARAQGAAQRRDRCSCSARRARARRCSRARSTRRPARARAVRGDQLRRVPRDPARERAVRPRPRRVHRREPRSRRALRAGERRDACSSDEIGETSLGFQVKLLRALQEGAVRPLGADREQAVDARIVAATNRELEREVEAGRFRARPLLPPERVPDLAAAAARAPRTSCPLVLQFLAGSREITGLCARRRRRAPPARDLSVAGQRARARERGRAHRHARRERQRDHRAHALAALRAAARRRCPKRRRAGPCATRSRASRPGTSATRSNATRTAASSPPASSGSRASACTRSSGGTGCSSQRRRKPSLVETDRASRCRERPGAAQA